MTPAERLKEIESRQDSPKVSFRLIRNDQKWLIDRVKRLTEALEKISTDLSYDYYPHIVARKALESEE